MNLFNLRHPLGLNSLVSVFAVAFSLFHLHVAIFGPPEELIFRAIHLGFVSVVLFLREQERPAMGRISVLVDMAIAGLAVASILYLLYDYHDIVNRFAYIDPVKKLEVIFGVVLVLIVLEGARRTTGPTLPIIAVVAMLYGMFGNYLPQGLRHQGLSLDRLIEQMYVLPDGIFGVPLGVSAKYIVIFVLFGAFLEQAKAGTFFTDLANSLVGRSRGGPAKVAVIASAMFGTISGAPVANVVVTGTFTIPAMKRIGFRPEVAGAIEAAASTGGALMPPVLGATCFIIVEFTGYPYSSVIGWALLPALLYYICIYATIHLEAIKYDVKYSQDEVTPFKKVLAQQGVIFIPIAVLLYLILIGRTPSFAAWVSIVAIIVVSWLRRSTRIGVRESFIALDRGGRNVVSIAMACACAGIITGVILLTGVGMILTSFFLRLSGGSLFILLLLIVIPLLILGMGMPAAPAYVICASIFAPAIENAGLSVPATHFFIYYYALLSAISPPVALAAFAASGISGASPMKTGYWAVRVAIAAYILPFAFAYSPELLLQGTFWNIVVAFATAIIGVIALVSGLQGILIMSLSWAVRIALVLVGVLMIIPGYTTDLIGMTVVGGVLTYEILLKKRTPLGLPSAPAEGRAEKT